MLIYIAIGSLLTLLVVGGIGISLYYGGWRLRNNRDSAPAAKDAGARVINPVSDSADLLSPQIIAPTSTPVLTPFEVRTKNIAPDSVVLSDKKWRLGTVGPDGSLIVTLSVPGIRTIDIDMGGSYVSWVIEVQGPTREEFTYISKKSKGGFDRFISLGPYCVTKFQIVQYLKEKFGQNADENGGDESSRQQDLNGGNYIFDWVVIGDYKKLILGFEREFDGIFFMPTLEIIKGGDSLLDRSYDITWHHILDRDADGKITKQILEEQYETKRSKVRHLLNKFQELRGLRTLYIVHIGDFSLAVPLSKAIEKYRGNSNFHIAFLPLLNHGLDRSAFQNTVDADAASIIPVFPVSKGSPTPEYYGDSPSWGKALSYFEFNPLQAPRGSVAYDGSRESMGSDVSAEAPALMN